MIGINDIVEGGFGEKKKKLLSRGKDVFERRLKNLWTFVFYMKQLNIPFHFMPCFDASLSSPLSAMRALHNFYRSFRSKAALDSLINASESKIPNLILYNYPSFSGAFSALSAHLYHSRLNIPFLILPFSSVEPLRAEDLILEGLETCYLLDFIGPSGFAVQLSRLIPRVEVFDHRKSTLAKVPKKEDCPDNLILHIDTERSSATAVYDYFSKKVADAKPSEEEVVRLLNQEDGDRVSMVIKYIEDHDLRRWALPDTKAFNIGLREERSKLNCVTNPYVFDQLLEISAKNMIDRGSLYISSREDAAKKLLGKALKVRLGRGFYGECLGIRADGNSDLSNEIGEELSVKSAAAGLRPIGAVVYMQRGNLKMCLRSVDSATDTSEIAKAYGGGGSRGSSSFILRMDEYNEWISVNSPAKL